MHRSQAPASLFRAIPQSYFPDSRAGKCCTRFTRGSRAETGKPARVAGDGHPFCCASHRTVLTLQIGTAVAVLAITALQLANVENWKDLYQTKLCKASGDPTNTSVCTYIYAVGAVSIVLTIIIGLLQVGRGVHGRWEGLRRSSANATCRRMHAPHLLRSACLLHHSKHQPVLQ